MSRITVGIVVMLAGGLSELVAAPAKDAALVAEVKAAIAEAAGQSFYGTIDYHQEMLIPPRPELLVGVARHDPDNAPVSSDAEANTRMRDFHSRIQEGMLFRALHQHTSAYDLAVTIGPGAAIRLDREQPDSPRMTTTVSRAGRLWQYNGGGTLLTCDAERGDNTTAAAWTLYQAAGEAEYVGRFFVNQFFDLAEADAVESVGVAADSSVVARMADEQGDREIEFTRVSGRLRVRRITRDDGDTVCRLSFARYMQVGDDWIPRSVEIVQQPGGPHGPEAVHRTTRTITAITPLAEIGLEALFAPPDASDPAYPELMYELDVTEPGSSLIPLHEGLPVLGGE